MVHPICRGEGRSMELRHIPPRGVPPDDTLPGKGDHRPNQRDSAHQRFAYSGDAPATVSPHPSP